MKLRSLHWRFILYLWLALFIAPLATTPQVSNPTSPALDKEFIKATVESAADVIHREYFDPDLAARMDQSLRQMLAIGHYANAATSEALASALTTDLYSISHDKHLSVTVAPATTDGPYAAAGSSQQSREDAVRVSNAAVQRVEILSGNVGYLNITSFFRPAEASDAIANAIHMLRHTDALILDMRDNAGGSPDTMALIASYCFDAPGLPLADIIPRSGEVQHYMTQSGIADRDGKRPTYVLTSARTWSGGEGLAYILQERHRAEIIGETTVGAANPGRPYQINATFYVTVPNSRVRSAVRGANWEGVGVKPDVPVPASDALRVAQTHALRQMLSQTPNGLWHDQLQQELGKLNTPPIP